MSHSELFTDEQRQELWVRFRTNVGSDGIERMAKLRIRCNEPGQRLRISLRAVECEGMLEALQLFHAWCDKSEEKAPDKWYVRLDVIDGAGVECGTGGYPFERGKTVSQNLISHPIPNGKGLPAMPREPDLSQVDEEVREYVLKLRTQSVEMMTRAHVQVESGKQYVKALGNHQAFCQSIVGKFETLATNAMVSAQKVSESLCEVKVELAKEQAQDTSPMARVVEAMMPAMTEVAEQWVMREGVKKGNPRAVIEKFMEDVQHNPDRVAKTFERMTEGQKKAMVEIVLGVEIQEEESEGIQTP